MRRQSRWGGLGGGLPTSSGYVVSFGVCGALQQPGRGMWTQLSEPGTSLHCIKDLACVMCDCSHCALQDVC
jgi:hypothetical protein